MSQSKLSKAAKLAELQELDRQIAARKKYYGEQEKLINDLVEAGNMQLMNLNHDILLAKQELKDIKTDTRNAKRDRGQALSDLEEMRTELIAAAPGLALAPA